MKNDNMLVLSQVSPQQLLVDEFSIVQRAIMGNAVTRGYQNVTEFQKRCPDFLRTKHAEKLIPELKNMSVEYAIINACEKGLIPLKWSFEDTHNKKDKYLKLISLDGRCLFTVNQTRSAGTKSRLAKYRQDLDDSFQTKLNLFPADDIILAKQPYYFELNHGYQSKEPKFAVIGKPKETRGWLAQQSLLNQVQLVPKQDRADLKTATKDIQNFNWGDFEQYIDAHEKD
ncbi:hypothetical protein [Lactiplantibacillus mudanjiangensis]|uniref:Uncharacterized protein n=1 Tax=Lactiplantibacillus mudanjiangensis TaxID=1296538 RepID=A0A660E2S2_9LACO|nr:hypothetical protein [Lactiplantibacillus mudanjiangensis]VDG25762.1 hypothetical protein [Lactobacillus brevis] [Lactiplantibacillus mudanjiangensis]VDG29636.1 hypothetical protein [Lactobacillus brevis] [Lactiplantibacillus mudanjiangensis]